VWVVASNVNTIDGIFRPKHSHKDGFGEALKDIEGRSCRFQLRFIPKHAAVNSG
jgi:hypothetical protein